MGCAPTSRKRTITPAGQVHLTAEQQLMDGHKGRRKNDEIIEKSATSLQIVQENKHPDKQNKRIVTSTRLMPPRHEGKESRLPFPDIVIREERRDFMIQKMDFVKRQHLQPS